MAIRPIRAERHTGRKPVADMAPMIGRRVASFDAGRLDRIDCQQDLFNLRPTVDAEQKRSEEHTSELQSLMRISYAVFCLKKKKCITIPRTTYIQPLHTKPNTPTIPHP